MRLLCIANAEGLGVGMNARGGDGYGTTSGAVDNVYVHYYNAGCGTNAPATYGWVSGTGLGCGYGSLEGFGESEMT
jgi:hypothetical protein